MAKQYFKKGEIIRQYDVIGNKVNTYCEELGIYNPTLVEFHGVGWEDYTPPTPPPYEPTRSEKIHAEIRERYSENTELQILRETAAGKEGAAERFAEYNAYVESVLAKYPEQ